MGIISNWLGGIVKRALSDENGAFFTDLQNSTAGVAVTKDSVVGISAVYAALNLLSSTIATLPLNIYKRKENDGREIARDFSLYNILHDEPNEMMTSVTFRRLMMVNYYIGGSAHAIIEWGKDGQVKELIPVPFWRIRRLQKDRIVIYEVYDLYGRSKKYNEYEIFRLENLGYSFGNPLKPLNIAKDLFGLAIATEQFGSTYFANGANAGGYLKYPGKLTDPVIERLAGQLEKKHTGVKKSHKTVILEEGMDFIKATIAPNDSQFIETRKFQVTEVARFFNVAPHLIMDLERSTYSNIEHQNINFVIYTLRAKLVEWEQEIKRSLLSSVQKKIYYAEFVVDGLLRGDSKTRAEVNKIKWSCGALNANEWRRQDNENPIGEEGDEYFVPLNMATMSSVINGDIEQQKSNALANGLADFLMRNTPAPHVHTHEARRDEEQAKLSTAQIRSATKRHTIARNYEVEYKQKAQELVKKETQALRKIIEETLSPDVISAKGLTAFKNSIRKFYEEFGAEIKKHFGTSFTALAKDIFAEALREINFDGEWNDRMQSFVEQYMDSYIVRHTGSSEGQLESLANDAQDNGLSEQEAVGQRLDEWDEKRAGKIGLNETVRLAGAIAKTAYVLGGIKKIMWVNMGSKSCPYCESMDGTVISIEKLFIYNGDDIEGADGQMKVYRNTGHPPLHQGCVCTIVSA